jgi:hypothetical protein
MMPKLRVIIVMPGFNVAPVIGEISDEGCGLVTGTRMVLGDALQKGMPV